jgi:hypothetical protein
VATTPKVTGGTLSVEKQGQRLHRRQLATRRRHGEIATAREAKIALKASHNSILHMIRAPQRLQQTSLMAGAFHAPCQGFATKMVNSILT